LDIFGRKPRQERPRMLRVGDFEISRVEELQLELWSSMLPDWQQQMASENHAWLTPDFYAPESDRFKISIHSWLVKRAEHRILIDTCAGNQKIRPTFKLVNELDTPWMERLGEAGVSPEDVDFVICTHFHVDHIGWNTRLEGCRWVPTFPNAKYVFPRREFEALDPAFGIAKPGSAAHLIFLDSILPVIEAGQAMFVEGDESILEGVDLIPAPGHSPGQVAVRIRSRGEEAMFVGDVLHHPLQIYHPDWNTSLCEDPVEARRTRLSVLNHCAQHGSLLAPAHFGRPHCGNVRRELSGFSFVPSEHLP
jgi:glyoxylase-like metal-dependent hydrolase (beta-lactamase superfamily II)